MDPISQHTSALQETVQLSMLKRAQDAGAAQMATLLAGVGQSTPAPTGAPPASPPGIGTLIDVRA